MQITSPISSRLCTAAKKLHLRDRYSSLSLGQEPALSQNLQYEVNSAWESQHYISAFQGRQIKRLCLFQKVALRLLQQNFTSFIWIKHYAFQCHMCQNLSYASYFKNERERCLAEGIPFDNSVYMFA